MKNRLAKETSPYLKQHENNPVDWYPWGQEALQKAKREGKPIFLSIGYSSCHWCHVMEKESFEDEATAKLLNEAFINIKVDREERPDLDQIYMSAVQLLTQHGGWPLSVFLTPELKPFYGSTYFPPVDRHGMPGFKKLIVGIAQAWKARQSEILESSNQLTEAIGNLFEKNTEYSPLQENTLANAFQSMASHFDSVHGGFGSAPKFFHPSDLEFCLRYGFRTQEKTAQWIPLFSLSKILAGGIRDHLGGGFHRYSTDAVWLVPHFEKMLYDNALLCPLFLSAYCLTQQKHFLNASRTTLDYMTSLLLSPEHAFYSAEDADSEGEEGKFYVWTKKEIETCLGDDLATSFCLAYGVEADGNWEGNNILFEPKPLEETAKNLNLSLEDLQANLETSRRKLLTLRAERPRPFRDEKTILAWHAMAVHAFAQSAKILEDAGDREIALQAADFVLKRMWDEEKKTYTHSYKDGVSKGMAFLDDYAYWIQACLSLYELTFDEAWLKRAKQDLKNAVRLFWDEKKESFFYTSTQHEALVTRPRETHDGATPSGSSLVTTLLLRLGHVLDEKEWLGITEKMLSSHSQVLEVSPHALSQLVIALEDHLHPPDTVVYCSGEDAEENEAVLQHLRITYWPKAFLVKADGKSSLFPSELFVGKKAQNNQTTLYVCRGFTCEKPWVGLEEIREKTKQLTKQ